MSKERVLITGATGFIGSHIMNALWKTGEYEIIALSTGRNKVDYPQNVTSVFSDMLDFEQVKYVIEKTRPDILVSVAWDMLQGGAFKKNSVHADWLGASMNILKYFVKCGGNYFLHHSSGSEYAAYSGHSELPKEMPLTLFGEVKHAFHKIAGTYCAMNGVKFVNTVCFNSLGERIRSNAAARLAIEAFLERKEFVCKAPYNIWDFTYVGDTAGAVAQILRLKYEGTVNIGRGIPVFVGDMFKKAAALTNAEHLLKLDYNNLRFEAIVPDVSLLNSEIGFVCETTLEKSMEVTVEWVKQNRLKGE